ncbi:MAG: hypothetical protein AAGE98_20510, partial [Actinomycetota bacterium]
MTPSSSPDAAWPTRAAARVEAVAARLATCGVEEFDATLSTALEEVAALFGIVAMGECTGDPRTSISWMDAEATSLEELDELTPLLDSGLGATGPYSVMAPSGRPGLAVPNPPGSFSHHLAILAGDEAGFTAEQTSLLGLFGSAVSAARRRVEATRSLHRRLRQQDVLSRVATAAVADESDTLQRILRIVKDEFDLGSATVWLRAGELLHLVESSELGETRHVERGITAPFDQAALDALAAGGHAVITVGDSQQSEPSPFDDELPTLVVPVLGPDGPEGVLAFVDPGADVGVDIAVSVARSAEKVLQRRRALEAADTRAATEQFMRWVATRIAQASHEDELDMLDDVLVRLNEHFDLGGSSVWELDEDDMNFVRRRGRWADASLITATESVPMEAFAVESFCDRGYGVLKHRHLDPLSGDFSEPQDAMLVVPLGEAGTADGILVMMGDIGRFWDDGTISSARTIGLMLQQGMARFDAERDVAYRLRLTELTQRVSAQAVEIGLENSADVVGAVLRDCAEFFDLAEAQVWRFADEHASLRYAFRPDQGPTQIGLRVPYPISEVGDGRETFSMRLGDIGDLFDGEHRDDPDSMIVA